MWGPGDGFSKGGQHQERVLLDVTELLQLRTGVPKHKAHQGIDPEEWAQACHAGRAPALPRPLWMTSEVGACTPRGALALGQRGSGMLQM